MNHLILKIKVVFAFIALVGDPRKTDRIFAIGDAVRKRRVDGISQEFAPILGSAEFRALHAERAIPLVRLEILRTFPAGSFGKAVAEFLDRHEFDPNSFPLLRSDDPLEFMISRLRQCHDLWHVLTGYETDVPGELGLQGFTYAQTGAAISPLIVAAGLLHLLAKNPASVRSAFEQIIDGYRRGKRCRTLVTFRLEDEWETDLEMLRKKLGLPGIGEESGFISPEPIMAGQGG